MKRAWWKEAVVYQVYPRSFRDSNGDGIGDLNGVTEKLDYIKALGADVIWLNPIYQSPNDDNGYDISDYRAIMKDFGTMADFERLLSAAHARGLKIVMDLVVNHTSDEHPWFVESRKSKDNPYRDYYIWREGKNGGAPNNWGSSFSGPAWKKCEETGEYYLHLFSPKQPDLNWDHEAVRRQVYDLMKFWLDKGIDGFRMDVINSISKPAQMPDGPVKPSRIYADYHPFCCNGPHVHEYLKEMNREVLSHYDVMTVGETTTVQVEDAQRYTGEDRHELNMVFHFQHMGLDNGSHGKWSDNRVRLADLKRVMTLWQDGLYEKGWNSLYWCNHDQARVVSRFGDDSTEENRVLSAKMLGTLLHMMQGTPYVYEGEELGMTNVRFEHIDDYRDLETLNAYREQTEKLGVSPQDMMRYIYRRSRDNARTPMQWSTEKNAGFTAGTPWIGLNPNYTYINAEAEEKDENSVLHYYRKLIALRKHYSVIVYGKYELALEDDPRIYAYTRTLDNERLLTLCNFTGESTQELSLASFGMTGAKRLIGNYAEDNMESFALRPYEARVYYLNKER